MKFGIKKLLELVGIERDERRWLSLDEVFNDAVSEFATWRPVSKVFNRSVSATLPMERLAMTRVAVEGDASYAVLPLGGVVEAVVRREIGEVGGDAGRAIPGGPGALAPVAVNRHEVIVDILRERGVVGDEMEVVSESAAAVRGRDVFGVLPLSLAAEARSVTTVSVSASAVDAGFPWDAGRVRERAGGVGRYMVVRIGSKAETDFMQSLGGGSIVDLFARARERALGGYMWLR